MNKNRYEEMINDARGTAERARQEFGLDYSLESLRRVDEMLASLDDSGDNLAGKAAFMMGCYVGEVIVREAGARWIVDEEKKNVFGSALVLECGTPDDAIQASPIARCFKRLKNDSDGVEAWGRVVTAIASDTFPGEVPEESGDEEVEWRSQRF